MGKRKFFLLFFTIPPQKYFGNKKKGRWLLRDMTVQMYLHLQCVVNNVHRNDRMHCPVKMWCGNLLPEGIMDVPMQFLLQCHFKNPSPLWFFHLWNCYFVGVGFFCGFCLFVCCYLFLFVGILLFFLFLSKWTFLI